MICFGSNSSTLFAWRGGHVSGNMVPQAVPHRHNEHVVAECHAATRDGGQDSPSGPSGRATEPDRDEYSWGVERDTGGYNQTQAAFCPGKKGITILLK